MLVPVPGLTKNVGLGDVVAYAAKGLGFQQTPGCGCARRQQTLNSLLSFQGQSRSKFPPPWGHDQARHLAKWRAVRKVPPPLSGSGSFTGVFSRSCTVTVSPDYDSVAAAVAAASDGDVICLGPGTVTWQNSNALNITKAITLIGAGPMPVVGAATSGGTTIIPDWDGHGAAALMGLTESTAGHLTLANITLAAGATTTSGNFGHVAVADAIPGGQAVIMHHMTMTSLNPGMGSWMTWVSNRGVAYRNIVTGVPSDSPGNQTAFIRCTRGGSTNLPAWESDGIYGSQDSTGLNQVYIETNTISYLSQMIDVTDGCRMVFRNNTVLNGVVSGHGQDSAAVSGRIGEVYDNVFTCSPGQDHISVWVGERGGTFIVTDNSFDAISPTGCGHGVSAVLEGPAITMGQYKLVQHQVGGWAPPYPTTYPVAQQIGWGYRSAGNTTTTGWGGALCPKGGASYGVCNGGVSGLTRSGTTATATSISLHRMNSGDSVLIQGASDANYNGTFTITKVDDNVFTYTVGGSPATPAVENPTITFWQTARGGQSQSLEPWYVWGNTGTSATKNTVTVTAGGPDDLGLGLLQTDFIQINREYYERAPQGGDPVLTSYTKYTYPHPLATVVSD